MDGIRKDGMEKGECLVAETAVVVYSLLFRSGFGGRWAEKRNIHLK